MKTKKSYWNFKINSMLNVCSIVLVASMFFLQSCEKEDDNDPPSENAMLYIASVDINTATTPDIPGSHYKEIEKWKNAGFSVTVKSMTINDNTTITADLLKNYKVLRLTNYYPHNYTINEGNAIYDWVNSGGNLFADIHYNADIQAVTNFGVDRIDGEGGGAYGLTWYYHGDPLEIGPVSGPGFSVGAIAIEAMDRPVLKSNHQLIIDATYDGYPVIVHQAAQQGRVVITFDGGSYSLDVVHPGNAYQACITMEDNLQFIKNVIDYFE